MHNVPDWRRRPSGNWSLPWWIDPSRMPRRPLITAEEPGPDRAARCACTPPLKWHSHQLRQPLDVEITLIIGPHRDRENHGRDYRGPDQLASHPCQDRRTGIGAGRALAVLVLAADTERQCQEQHEPPQHEVDRKRGGDIVGHRVQACSISTSAPEKSLGWKNSTGLPWAPIFGTPSPRTRAPSLIIRSRAAMMSGTS